MQKNDSIEFNGEGQPLAKPSVRSIYPLPETLPCPKCSAVRFESQKECFTCGLVFKKYEDHKAEREWKEKVGGIDHLSLLEIRKLRSQWRVLVTQYDKVELHDSFIRKCMEVGAIPFASWSYQKILNLNPDDLIAPTQLKKIKGLVSYSFEKPKASSVFSSSRTEGEGSVLSRAQLTAIEGLTARLTSRFTPMSAPIFSSRGKPHLRRGVWLGVWKSLEVFGVFFSLFLIGAGLYGEDLGRWWVGGAVFLAAFLWLSRYRRRTFEN